MEIRYLILGIVFLVVTSFLIRNILKSNKEWKAIAEKLNGVFSPFCFLLSSGVFFIKRISGSYHGYKITIDEFSPGKYEGRYGITVKFYIPMNFCLMLWPKNTILFYKKLKKVAIGTEVEQKYDIYSDKSEYAATFFNNSLKKSNIAELKSKGDIEINSDSIVCTYYDEYILGNPLGILKRKKIINDYGQLVKLLDTILTLK